MLTAFASEREAQPQQFFSRQNCWRCPIQSSRIAISQREHDPSTLSTKPYCALSVEGLSLPLSITIRMYIQWLWWGGGENDHALRDCRFRSVVLAPPQRVPGKDRLRYWNGTTGGLELVQPSSKPGLKLVLNFDPSRISLASPADTDLICRRSTSDQTSIR